jgi:ribose 5-phosphate isomerase A
MEAGMTDPDELKRAAAAAAVALVRSDSVLGLGSGSTAAFVIEEVGRRLRHGQLERVLGVPTSLATERAARDAGIPLVELPADGVALAIDGMDEVAPGLDAIKGLGGAMVREKVVAASAQRFVLVGDDTKRVRRLGERAPVPVEVLPFGWRRTEALLTELGARPTLRRSGSEPYVSDNGNLVMDCRLEPGFDAPAFAAAVDALPGVVGHGLFLGIATLAFVAGPGGVERLEARPDGAESRGPRTAAGGGRG